MAQRPLADKIRQALNRIELRDRVTLGRKRTHEEIAQAADLTKSYLTNLLNSRQSNPSISAVEQLAGALEVPPFYFLPSGPDDVNDAVWLASPQVTQWIDLIRGLSPAQVETMIRLAQMGREQLETLAGEEAPQGDDGHAPSRRRHRGRRQEQTKLSPEEAARRIAASLRGG